MKNQTILTLSPKGQITIPSRLRKKYPAGHYILYEKGTLFTLEPVKVTVEPLSTSDDETKDFHLLAEPSLSFWNSQEDEANEEFYNNAPAL